MYEITIEDSFDAAHCIPGYSGNCERLHGHTYRVKARFRYTSLGSNGMAVDFREVRKLLKEILSYMDHNYINDLPEFSGRNPTAENIAGFIFERVKGVRPEIHSVSVWETPNACATYYEDE